MELQNPSGDVTGKVPQPSKVDLLTGKHTTPIIVAVLVFIILTAVVLIIIFVTPQPTDITTRLLDAILILVGFFTGTKISKKE